MEFEKLFRLYTVCVVVILVATTLVCVCFAVINKVNGNLGAIAGNVCLESCTQILQLYC